MMPARGNGGRMKMSGRGGRGGMGNRIPSKLDIFNRYVGFKILGFCDRDDQENLGFAFPQFTPAPLTQQQMQIRMKKIAEKKKELKNPYGIKDIDLNEEADATNGDDRGIFDYNKKSSNTSKNKTNKEKENSDTKDEENEIINDSNPEQSSIETEMDPEKKKQMMKQHEE